MVPGCSRQTAGKYLHGAPKPSTTWITWDLLNDLGVLTGLVVDAIETLASIRAPIALHAPDIRLEHGKPVAGVGIGVGPRSRSRNRSQRRSRSRSGSSRRGGASRGSSSMAVLVSPINLRAVSLCV